MTINDPTCQEEPLATSRILEAEFWKRNLGYDRSVRIQNPTSALLVDI